MKSFCGIAWSVDVDADLDHQPISSSAACATTVGGVWPSMNVTSLTGLGLVLARSAPLAASMSCRRAAVVVEVALLARGEQTVGGLG